MASYKLLVNDNSHYMDITEVTEHGVLPAQTRRWPPAKRIADDDLASMWQPDTTRLSFTGSIWLGEPTPSLSP
jgi:hypothetical protein